MRKMTIRERLDNWEDGYDMGVENTLANVREAIEKVSSKKLGLLSKRALYVELGLVPSNKKLLFSRRDE